MTRNEILQRYPNASESFIRRNFGSAGAIPNPKPEHHPVVSRDPKHHSGEEKGQGRCRVVIESRRNRLCDADNLYCKALLDAVRYAGLIRDDSPDDIELIVRQTKVKKKDEETVVMIERIPEISATEAANYYEHYHRETANDREITNGNR